MPYKLTTQDGKVIAANINECDTIELHLEGNNKLGEHLQKNYKLFITPRSGMIMFAGGKAKDKKT